MSTNAASTIFVGSSLDLSDLAAGTIADPLLADGDVGFYGHMSGVITSFEDGTEQSLLSEWAGTGAGLVELSQTEPMAIMSVTIANTGTAAITVPVGQLVSSASGVQYQISEMPRLAAGWSPGGAGDGTLGGYTIQPGQSLTLYAQALLDGPSGNLLANQVTQIAVPGAAVVASTLITAAPQWGAGTLTLVNSSSTSQIIYEGVVVTGSSGSYEIGVDPTVSGFVPTEADSSSGYYVLKAGGTITVPIAVTSVGSAANANAVVLQEQAEDASANSITGGYLPAGVHIVGSSAITTEGVTAAAQQEHVNPLGSNAGFFTDAQAALFTTDQGYVPTEADVNTYNDYIWTAEDLANWKAYVDSARAVGILNLAPMLSEFETVDFATSDATAYVRAAALYSGGIAFDMPSWFFLAREPAYQQSIEEEIRWATQNGLRSSITLSPQSGDDENFLADTQQVVAILRAAGALPTQFVVKDGGVTGTDVIYSTTDPNSLNNVGNWLSSLTLTPSNSESGLENRGTAARPDDLMTGVQQGEALVGPAVKQPFSAAQLFADTPTTEAALTVTLGNPSLGRLVAAAGLGSVSSNGAVFTASGTIADLTTVLQSLDFVDAAGVAGTTALTTRVQDAAGTITGTTVLVIDNTITLSGVPATAAVNGPLMVDSSLSLTTATPGTILTAVVTLSNPALGSFWGTAGATVSADGSTLTIDGTASALQAFLRQIEFIPAPAVSGPETATVSVTDGTDTISSSTAISVAVATGMTADNVPVSIVVSPFIVNTPYADLLLAKTGSPGQVVGVTVTLSGGGHLVDPVAGAVSANGLSFSYVGTFAQEQAALRALEVVVAPGAATSAQTLSFNLNGHVATTALEVVSTDTVFVGAVDATQGGYASAAVAAPLLATGKVGLFADYNGATATAIAGTSASLAGTWSGTAAGVYGYNEGTDVAQQAITVRNTGTGTLLIPVGTLAQTASGVQFQVVQSTGANADWSAGPTGDGSLGVYGIAAGASVTLTVEALAQGDVGNVAANAITSLPGIANASVTASTAILLATEYASGTVTLTNTGSSSVIVNEGTVLTNATGSYQIGNDPTANDFNLRNTDSSNGIYYLAPGASTTVAVYGINPQSGTAATALTQILAQTTTATNTLSSNSLPAGVVVAASSAIGVAGPATAAQGATWGGWGPDTGILTERGYGYFLPDQGVSPSEANTNIALSTNFTAADLTSWQGYVDTLRGLGILNVAPTLTGSGVLQDISRSDATAYLRSAALYGGGVDVDMTPSVILSQGAAAMTALVDDVQWATANGLRTTLTLRAYSDASFLENTKAVLSQLQAAGALPSQVVVVGSPTSSTIAQAELANSVAQYAAGLALTPSASESGLADTGRSSGGSNGVGVDAIMTGVRTSEAATGPAAISPYAGVQVFDQTPSEQVTATAALVGTGLGILSTGGPGTVSADGSTVTVSGTASAVAAALAAIRYTPASGSTGTAALTLSIADSHGTITGNTSIAVDSALSISGMSNVAVNGAVVLQPGLALSLPAQASSVTATVTLSNPALGAFWNLAGATVSADGGTATITGSAGTVRAFLSGLQFMPTATASGTEAETVTVNDGIGTVTAASTLTVSVATGFVASNLPAASVVSPFIVNTPYADLLLAKTGSPGQVVGVTVTLSGGGHLVDPVAGAVSANGLSFSYVGTFAQEQAALRALEVVVAPGAATSAQTLSFNLNGHVATTALEVVSTDTVFVGAVDATQGGYASAAVAAPLLATGKVGLFADYNGATATAIAGTSASLAGTWSGTAAGVYGYNEGTDVAQQAITVRNTGTGTLLIPVGTLAQTASGVQFQVVQSTGANADWSAGPTGDGSLGVYGIAAGASVTLTVEALAQGDVGNVAANAITSLPGIANASVTASTAILLATEYASGTVTLTNTGSNYAILGQGMTLTNSSGTYQIDNSPTATGFVSTGSDNSSGYYALAPGASTTVAVSGVNPQSGTAATALTQILAQTTSSANTLSSGSLPAGVVVAASSAIGVTGPATAAQGATWGGWGPDTGILTERGYGYFLPDQGVSPSEANTNIALSTNFTAADLTSWQGYVDTLRGLGILNVAPTLTGSGVLQDISRSDATAYLRSAALYGGGVDVDMTPSVILSQGAAAMTALVDDVQWATANGLRTTLTLRAYSDASFLENTKAVLSQLQAAGALPSQVVVVGSPTSSTIAQAELANSVAQYAAGLALTPSASESGLADTGRSSGGSNGVGVDAIMTGVRTSEAATGPAAISPYAGVQVFDQTPSEQVTATAALVGTGLGILSTGGPGTVSADGSTVTVSGTASAVAAALAAIRYTPASGSTGTAALTLSIADSHGTITGNTSIAVGPGQSLAVAALNTSGANSQAVRAFAPAASPATTITVATPAAQHDTLLTTAGGGVSNGVFQVAGSVGADMAALSGLTVSTGAGTAPPSLQITLSGAPVSFTDDGAGQDSIASGGGNLIQTGAGRTVVAAGLGDTVSAGSGSVSASGPQGFTFLGGSSAADTVTGGAGGGSFTAGTGGGSLLIAGTGATVLHAAGGNDTLVGGGNTTLYASDNKNSVLDATNGDTVVGAGGASITGPASGNATVLAQSGAETVTGAAGAISVTGGSGSLVVRLGTGNASVTGGSGSDTVLAGAGGHYAIADGTGAELVELQQGVSTGAALTLTGFVPGKDQIALSGYGTGAAQLLVSTQSSSAGGTVLTLSDGATITLSGIAHLAQSSISSL